MTHGILGIDAAWTATQPSGVAFVAGDGEDWRLLACAASYRSFVAIASGEAPEIRPSGGHADVIELLDACRALHSTGADLIAVDMPLSTKPITGRRAADDAVSRTYGARHCGTHTPSITRPGPISDSLTAAFARAGYLLATSKRPKRGLIEVYPHPALVELAKSERRLPYKAGNVSRYWPALSAAERRKRLFEEWTEIVALLDDEIDGVASALPLPSLSASTIDIKAFEDKLDAVVCAWIGMQVLTGSAIPFGDDHAAIWIPAPCPNPHPFKQR